MTPAKRHEMRKRAEELSKARKEVRLGLAKKSTKTKKRK